MNNLLIACQFLPLFGVLLILMFGNTEQRVANLSLWTTHAMEICIIALLGVWIDQGFPSHEYLLWNMYQHEDFHFPLLFYFDKVAAAYLFCFGVLFSVIVRYCRYYLHREDGYKRFFLTIFAFAFGLNIVILSGHLDLFFAGWEIVGICSFLLIAFYRHRTQPVRNALRVYSIYRFCDIGLLLGAWLSDLLLHGNNHFSELAPHFSDGNPPPGGYLALFALSLFIIIAATGKSAQFPFCFWVPRAMEGPTPSSAIFYGSLSVHLGVFLLLRTQPIWEFLIISRVIVFSIGLLTVCVANISEKTQSNIKGQIAYASITQVGFMFMELALGWDWLVILHFLGNAFLRCYQLLVSPSIVAHLLRIEGAADTGFDIKSSAMARSLPLPLRDALPEVLQNTLQVLALQEFNLDIGIRSLLWEPFMRLGAAINAIGFRRKLMISLSGVVVAGVGLESGLLEYQQLVPPIILGMAIASLNGFSQKHDPFNVWNSVGFSGLLAGIATWLTSENADIDVEVFLMGIIPAWLLGMAVLNQLLKGEDFAQTPFAYRAMAERKPMLAWLLFLSFLGLVGFPISPAFIGEDLLLYHISSEHAWIVPFMALAFVLNGIAAGKVFLRLCMGRPVEIRHNPA